MDTVLKYIQRVLRLIAPEYKTGEMFMPPINEITRKQFYIPDDYAHRQLGDTYISANDGTVYVWQGDQWALLRADDERVAYWRA